MADKSMLYVVLLFLLQNDVIRCRTLQSGRSTHRKSALGHMVPYDQKSIVVHKVKVEPTNHIDLEVKEHHSVRRVLTDNDFEGLWLEDFNKDYLDEMQSDSAVAGALISPPEVVAQCPPPPKEVPSTGCSSRKCTSDKQCGGGSRRCCYNGCAYTCMSAMPPPPYVDWQNEPPRRLQSGMSWLVPGPEEQAQVESCSTSVLDDDEDMLLCPHGFICHIEFHGNTARGIPNRGHCVQENTGDIDVTDTRQKFRIETQLGKEGNCVYDGATRRDGEKFTYHNHQCECNKGDITCKVGNT